MKDKKPSLTWDEKVDLYLDLLLKKANLHRRADTSEVDAQLQAIRDEYESRLEMHKANPDIEPEPMRLPRIRFVVM